MKRYIICAVMLIAIVFAGCAAGGPDAAATDAVSQTLQTADGMELKSAGIIDGIIDTAYGANGKDISGNVPLLSPPLEITGAPEGTVCYAVYMDDPDSEPLCGYRWIHWMAVNITENVIPEDFSRQAGDKAVQGKNDFEKTGYGGPTSPDKDHTYVITAYALDSQLALTEGFTKDEFMKAIERHVLASATLTGVYKK